MTHFVAPVEFFAACEGPCFLRVRLRESFRRYTAGGSPDQGVIAVEDGADSEAAGAGPSDDSFRDDGFADVGARENCAAKKIDPRRHGAMIRAIFDEQEIATMRMKSVLLPILMIAFTALPGVAQYHHDRGQEPPRAGACFYNDPGFTGRFFCMRAGERMPAMPPGFNDSITSVRVFGGARVRLFADGNFQSASILIDHDVEGLYHLRVANNPSVSWDDATSSVIVFGLHGDRDDWDDRGRQPR